MLNLKFWKVSAFTFPHFLFYWKVYFSPSAMGSVKLSSTDHNELNKLNPKSLAHVGSKKSFVKLTVPKNELFHFIPHFSLYWKVYFFHPKPWFPKTHHIYKYIYIQTYISGYITKYKNHELKKLCMYHIIFIFWMYTSTSNKFQRKHTDQFFNDVTSALWVTLCVSSAYLREWGNENIGLL